MKQTILIPLSLLAILAVPACSTAGMALGTGAALGVASQQEGGLSGAADDLRIKAHINDLWFKYDLNTFAKLSLNISQGRVLITGVVQDPDARVEAVRLAWQVKGVTQVINEIQVAEGEGLPGFVRDQWITTRLRSVLTFDKEVHSINYSIETVKGVVYLMGNARTQAELDRVIEQARIIPNVRQVISYVKLIGDETPLPGEHAGLGEGALDHTSAPLPLTAPVDAQPLAPHDMYGASDSEQPDANGYVAPDGTWTPQ